MKFRLRLVAFLTAAILFCPAAYASTAAERETVRLGGMNFGVKILSDGALVVGLGEENSGASPASRAGVRLRDVVTAVNGKKISSAAEVAREVETGNGCAIRLTVRRGSESREYAVTPKKTEDGYKIGLWLRDTSAGLGTVTFYDEETQAFGGLGHGICDGETGALLPLRRGEVRTAEINGITRSTAGKPGEMRGTLGHVKIGTLYANTSCGVFGVFSSLPAVGQRIEVAYPHEVHTGDATLYTTLDCGEVRPYTVKITSVDADAKETKCFTVEVTDKTLLEKTGGIVQGMSGSPIVQDGRLVGALTHVLVSDGASGYGIFIENMVNAMPGLLTPRSAA